MWRAVVGPRVWALTGDDVVFFFPPIFSRTKLLASELTYRTYVWQVGIEVLPSFVGKHRT